ncbi:uncharacterized protein LOC100177795 isoform X2 [Ciona intestinalis]
MSVVTSGRTQRRDKSSTNAVKSSQVTKATADQIRLAQMISNNGREDDVEMHNSVEKIIEITGTSEDIARTALYDTNNDTNRAIELILEGGSFNQKNEWETATRRKGKTVPTSGQSNDSYDEEIKEDFPSQNNRERSDNRGRGRGKGKGKRGKSGDRDRTAEDDTRGLESRDRQRGGRRGRGRGNSNAGRGGRYPARGPRRFARYNRGGYSGPRHQTDANNQNEFDDGFGTFNKHEDTSAPTEVGQEVEEDWGMEVGTWTNDDTQKSHDKKNDSFSEAWGTESWNDDLTETKVFQSQNTMSAPITGALPSTTTISNHVQPSSAPQMGERIDIDSLFKKNHPGTTTDGSYKTTNDGLVFNNSSSTHHSPPSVIQQLQQQGQSNSLFSDSKPVNEMDAPSSRLFGSYDSQNNKPGSVNTNHYGGSTQGHAPDNPYAQYNGKVGMDEQKGSALLGTFGEQFKGPDQSTMLGQISDITKSAFTVIKPNEPQGTSGSPDYNNFSQAQQREATEAVKASLGLPPVTSEQVEASHTMPPGLPQSQHNTLSFGAPQSVISQPKQQRRKQNKIPASAVEMPGSGGGGYHELSSFDLQFGVDDHSSAPPDFEQSNATNQSNLYNQSVAPSQTSMLNHMPPSSIPESSMFSSQINSNSKQMDGQILPRSSYQSLQPELTQNLNQIGGTSDVLSGSQTTEASFPHHTQSQRFPDSMKSAENLRGPPGIAHPQSHSSSTPSGGQTSLDMPGVYPSGRISASGNLPIGLPHETTIESSHPSHSHSYYTSTSHAQQSQQSVPDISNSAGRSIRSPIPTSSLPSSLQVSPMAHITGTPSKDSSAVISSLASGLGQTHITPHVGSTPTKLTPSTSAPINISKAVSPSSTPLAGSLSGGTGYMNMQMPYSANSSMQSQNSMIPSASSPGKHLSSNDLYTSAGHPSSHPGHQSSTTSSNTLGSALGGATLPSAANDTNKQSSLANASKAGPPNLPLGVPPLLANQYGIPVAPGLMTAYTPEALYGYTDPLMAVQSRVVNHQIPSYYDMSSFHNTSNQSASSASVNRDSTSATSSQGKFGRGEPSSPTPGIGMMGSLGSGLAQQQVATGQHNAQMKVSQAVTHQSQQPFMNIQAAAAPAAYPGFNGLYYNAFQYPPMYAATAVPQNAKHSVNTTTAFQQHGTGYGNAYSTGYDANAINLQHITHSLNQHKAGSSFALKPSVNVSTASNLHDLQNQGFGKNHITLTAAMAAANTGAAGAAGGGPGMSPYTQAPFMTMLHAHHLHLPQHNDVGQSVGSQRSQQATSTMGKNATKAPFGSTGQYWGN